jgi:hypothetical protein
MCLVARAMPSTSERYVPVEYDHALGSEEVIIRPMAFRSKFIYIRDGRNADLLGTPVQAELFDFFL